MTNWNFIIGSDGMGTAAIALMIGSDHTFILDMSGSGIGITSGPANITIPETLGADPSPKSYSSSSSFSTGSIVGLTLGLIGGVVLLVGLAFFVRRKRNSRSQKGPTPKNQAMPLATTRDYTQGISIPSAGTKYNVRPAHVPEASAPAVTFIGAGNADAGHFPRDHFSVQQLQFSSHPRPNFVTTLGGDGADNPVQLSETRTRDDTPSPLNSALWSPRPFVPPARSSGVDLSLTRDWTSPSVLPTAPQQHSPYSQLDSDFAMRSVSHTASVSPSTSPAVSTHSRLSPQEGSPQAVTSSNSPQYRGD
ncbi:hypothetical protein BGZ98_003378 [Dissophora globulifera]|nr:hypothetical protein BGZ98_003378 [Dissophora globulifera]